jgi:anti-sigma factor (TIGR02949 family)
MTDTPRPPGSQSAAPAPALKGGIDCRTALEQLWEYLDGELSPDRMEAVRTHVALCAKCYPQYDFEKAFLDAVGNCRKSQCVSHRMRGKIMDALQRLGFDGARRPAN